MAKFNTALSQMISLPYLFIFLQAAHLINEAECCPIRQYLRPATTITLKMSNKFATWVH